MNNLKPTFPLIAIFSLLVLLIGCIDFSGGGSGTVKIIGEGLPSLVFTHKTIAWIQFFTRFTKAGIEIEVAGGPSTRAGETGGNEFTIG